MKKQLTLIFILVCSVCYSQKPPIEFDTYKSWTDVTIGKVSGNGKYAFYVVDNYPVGNSTFYITTTNGRKLDSIANFQTATFSPDSRYIFGKVATDSLLRYDLVTRRRTFYSNVSSFSIERINNQNVLFEKSKDDMLTIRDFSGKKIFQKKGTKQSKISRDGRSVVLEQSLTMGNSILIWIDSETFTESTIYKGSPVNNLLFNYEDNKLAFITNNNGKNIILNYDHDINKTDTLITEQKSTLNKALVITPGRYWRYSSDGKHLFFGIVEKKNQRIAKSDPNVEIWSFEDVVLGSFWYGKGGNFDNIQPREYLGAIDIETKDFVQVTTGNDIIINETFSKNEDSLVVVVSQAGNSDELWNKQVRPSYYLINTKNANRLPLELNCKFKITEWSISPDNRYIIYYDPNSKVLVSYDIIGKNKMNVQLPSFEHLIPFTQQNYPNPELSAVKLAGWLNHSLCIRGQYDLWQIDHLGKNPPKNITGGYGEKESVIFNLIESDANSQFTENDWTIISGMNRMTKDLGFYRLRFSNSPNLQKLGKGAWYAGSLKDYYTRLTYSDIVGTPKSGYLVRLTEKNHSSNFYFSKDLSKFIKISKVYPENAYNWFTTELMTYYDAQGNLLQGVLYKPENFDPTKKYPVLLNIYEKKSGLLNSYQSPMPPYADFNIPLMVSNGFLVFLPDIKGKPRLPGKSALLSVNAALDELFKRQYIDSTKMAITGHSFGGFEANYIVTHSNRFAAAIIGAGVSNMISNASSTWWDGASKEAFVLRDFPMMNDLLGINPEIYVENSPILYAKNVKTPILFMHNDNDGSVYPEHTKSLFMVLRSLEKPCWWLNYKGKSHILVEEEERLDYQQKVFEFLNYYLKGSLKPEWMKSHI